MDCACNGWCQRIWILLRSHKEAPLPSFLISRLIHHHGRHRNDVLVIHIRHHAHNPPWLHADADEFHHAVCPSQFAIQRVLAGKERLREALAHNHYAFGAVLVRVSEVAPLHNRHTQRFEIPRRYRTKLRAPIIQSVLACGTLRCEGEADVQSPIVTPWNAESGRYMCHSRQSTYPALHFPVEILNLLWSSSVVHCRKIYR